METISLSPSRDSWQNRAEALSALCHPLPLNDCNNGAIAVPLEMPMLRCKSVHSFRHLSRPGPTFRTRSMCLVASGFIALARTIPAFWVSVTALGRSAFGFDTLYLPSGLRSMKYSSFLAITHSPLRHGADLGIAGSECNSRADGGNSGFNFSWVADARMAAFAVHSSRTGPTAYGQCRQAAGV